MSIGDVAGLIAALAFVLLVGFLAYPLIKLGKVFDETRNTIRELSEETVPLITEVTATVGSPLVKVAAFSYGVRQAMSGRRAGRRRGRG